VRQTFSTNRCRIPGVQPQGFLAESVAVINVAHGRCRKQLSACIFHHTPRGHSAHSSCPCLLMLAGR
jgi:hypothetical protein